jgi:hypothetical protein
MTISNTPLRLISAGSSMTISNTPIASTDFSRFFHDYIKHTPLDWLQQVFPWLYQTHSPLRLTSAGFSMTISNTHLFDWLQQVFPWLYQTHPSPRLTSAGIPMTISNTPIASTDFSRFSHDYIKHTHCFDWLQQVFPWLYQTHPSLRLTSADLFCIKIALNILILSYYCVYDEIHPCIYLYMLSD